MSGRDAVRVTWATRRLTLCVEALDRRELLSAGGLTKSLGAYVVPSSSGPKVTQPTKVVNAHASVEQLLSELAQHEPAAVEPREHLAFARNALPGTRIGELDQQVGAGSLSFQCRHGHIDHDGFAVRCFRDRR